VLYAITHRTAYRYESTVSISQHLAHLRPRETPRQRVLDYTLEVQPEPGFVQPRTDYYGNTATTLAVESPHERLAVIARSRVEVDPAPFLNAAGSRPWEQVRDACTADVLTLDSEASEFLYESPYVAPSPAFADYAAESFTKGRPVVEGLMHFTARIFHDFRFDSRATTIATPLSEVFRRRRGVCQDFAHLGIACLRSIGLPARYVSGYLETIPPPGKARLVGADASHAWFSVWCSGQGWVDADPTNNVLPSDRHITEAWGRDFSDVTPLRGVVIGGGEHRLSVSVDVARL
jgi:transglutaminase-like putative cysteine protease